MPKVSIIMPSLNVAKYILECMESVLKQTLQDIEVICVDAGSTDGTLEILQEYAKRDNRIRLIASQKKSYGYQMNLGLKTAKGQYIGIVETDDFVAPEMYEELYDTAISCEADFVKSDFDVFTTLENGERVYLTYSIGKYTSVRYNQIFSSEDYKASKQTIDIFIWNGIYRKKFLEENHIWFQETPGAAFQDCGFRYQVALKVKKGWFIQKSFYKYRRDNVGSSTYDKRCVLFNLSECRNLLKLVYEKEEVKQIGKMEKEFLAREIAMIALGPYSDMLKWTVPDQRTPAALEEFRSILKYFIDHGLLARRHVSSAMWLEIRFFVENPDFYEYYVHMKAETEVSYIRDFLKEVSAWKQVILFGSGQVGRCAYTLLRINQVNNLVAFADNDESKWGKSIGGCLIRKPEQLAKEYPKAYYLITNARYPEEIRSQLKAYGIPESRIRNYTQTTFPLACTNIFMGVPAHEE